MGESKTGLLKLPILRRHRARGRFPCPCPSHCVACSACSDIIECQCQMRPRHALAWGIRHEDQHDETEGLTWKVTRTS